MTGWQPIETAPRDKNILLCKRGYEPSIGRWVEYKKLRGNTELLLQEGSGAWLSFDPIGVFDDNELVEYLLNGEYLPDVWAPLPEPPK